MNTIQKLESLKFLSMHFFIRRRIKHPLHRNITRCNELLDLLYGHINLSKDIDKTILIKCNNWWKELVPLMKEILANGTIELQMSELAKQKTKYKHILTHHSFIFHFNQLLNEHKR